MDSFTAGLYGLTLLLLIISASKDINKTKRVLGRALRSFLRILPSFISTLVMMAVALTYLPPPVIASLLGEQSGVLGIALTAIVGAVAMIPGFIVFPLAQTLLNAGAGQMQVALLVSTLMTVSFITAPVEAKYFGFRATMVRNILAFAYAFVAALAISWVTTP